MISISKILLSSSVRHSTDGVNNLYPIYFMCKRINIKNDLIPAIASIPETTKSGIEAL